MMERMEVWGPQAGEIKKYGKGNSTLTSKAQCTDTACDMVI